MNDRFACLFLPLLYTLLWFFIHYLIIGMKMPFYSVLIPSVYGFGHLMACRHKGHISLSADSVALPLASVVALTLGSIEVMAHTGSKLEASVGILTAFGASLMGAHMIAFAAAYLYEKIKSKF